MSAFREWCAMRGVPALPATPALVAEFVRGFAPLNADRAWEALAEVSKAHHDLGYSDPTRSGPACEAMNEVSKLEPPRSWPRDNYTLFFHLPYPLQKFMLLQDEQRTREIKRLQRDVAELRKSYAGKSESE